MRNKISLAILFIHIAFVVAAQSNRRILDNRVMYSKFTVYDFFKEGKKWAWDLDVVYRRQSILGQGAPGKFIGEPLRISIRPWLAYQFTKYTRVSFNPIGMFVSAPRYPLESDLGRSFERELRTTLQINHSAYYGRVNFTHRHRYELRWRGIDDPDGPTFNFRYRYRIRTRVPINTKYFYTNKTWYVSQYSEIHIELGKSIGMNIFSQNRNYIGVGYRFWYWARVEAGYVHQYNLRGNGLDVDLSRGPMFYLFIDYLSGLKRDK